MREKVKNTFMDDVVEVGVSLLIGYAVSRYVRVAIARGQSMIPTIKHNQPVLLDCQAYKRREPRRNDLIAFNAHLKGHYKFFLKRVIGVPGDHVVMKENQVFVNGVRLSEPYLNEPMVQRQTIEQIVPKGEVFVLGDNRQNSLDSRSHRLGTIKLTDVVGVVKTFK
ncbi:MAG TPA: signal peptidase I [Firmicutes bacterium]|nr:signal peptidase I [Bacillota bacterium]